MKLVSQEELNIQKLEALLTMGGQVPWDDVNSNYGDSTESSEETAKVIFPKNLRENPGLARHCLDAIEFLGKPESDYGHIPAGSFVHAKALYAAKVAAAAYTRSSEIITSRF